MRRFSGFTLVLNVFYCVTPEVVWGHREEARRWICSVWKLFTESSARILSWVWRTMRETFTRKTVPTGDAVQIAITEVGYGERN
jgi:hypothetical protein